MKPGILIAGGSGLVGTALLKEASGKGYDVLLLSRSEGAGKIKWSPSERSIEIKEPIEFDCIINLAGSSLSNGRWTKERKKEIYESRIHSASTLKAYLQNGLLKTKSYIGASGIGIYGDRGKTTVAENTPIIEGDDWLVNLVIDWEKSHMEISGLGIRTCIIRTGIALSRDGGALEEILEKSKMGVLPYFGNGSQIWPWIHIADLARMILFTIENESSKGIYLGTAPNPVSNKELIKTINDFIRPKKMIAGVPRFMLALILGEMHHVLFESCNAIPARILEEGYHFRYPTIDLAAENLFVTFSHGKK